MGNQLTGPEPSWVTAERTKAFVDAVVAIAMTLLILPLVDTATSSADGGTVSAWFVASWPKLLAFAVSFAIVATFWLMHHRLYARVEKVTTPLLVMNIGWMLLIVWFPVPTAMTGEFHGDGILLTLYIGTMCAISGLLLAMRLYLRTHPNLHANPAGVVSRGIRVQSALTILYALALTAAVLIPGLGYSALFLVAFTSPLARIIPTRDTKPPVGVA